MNAGPIYFYLSKDIYFKNQKVTVALVLIIFLFFSIPNLPFYELLIIMQTTIPKLVNRVTKLHEIYKLCFSNYFASYYVGIFFLLMEFPKRRLKERR
jgi:hypothetical protein